MMKTLLVLLPLTLVACQNTSGENGTSTSTTSTYRIATTTPYYATSPSQASPPDGTFKSGTRVTIIEEAGPYALVKTDAGDQGWVERNALSGR